MVRQRDSQGSPEGIDQYNNRYMYMHRYMTVLLNYLTLPENVLLCTVSVQVVLSNKSPEVFTKDCSGSSECTEQTEDGRRKTRQHEATN